MEVEGVGEVEEDGAEDEDGEEDGVEDEDGVEEDEDGEEVGEEEGKFTNLFFLKHAKNCLFSLSDGVDGLGVIRQDMIMMPRT